VNGRREPGPAVPDDPPPRPAVPLMPGTIGPWMARAAGAAGLVFAVLFTVSFALIRVGKPPADPAAFAAWWGASRDRVVIGTYLLPFAGMAFIWFVAAVRRRIGSGEGLFFSTVFLGSALVFVALVFVTGAAISAVLAAEALDPDHAQVAAVVGFSFGYEVFFGFAVRMAAMFMITVASIGRASTTLPRALVLFTLVLGLIALLGNTFLEPFALIFPAWVALVSLALIRWGDA
jgi:hypothetical protein